jgi:hypothetical protein
MSGQSNNLPLLWDIPYIDSQSYQSNQNGHGQHGQNSQNQNGQNGRSTTKLQYQIQALRADQSLSELNTDPSNASSPSGNLLTLALKRQLEAEARAETARLAYLTEQGKRTGVQAALDSLMAQDNITRGTKKEKNLASELKKNGLLTTIASHANTLELVLNKKKTRLRASIVISMFLKKRVIKEFLLRKEERGRNQLGHALLGVFQRKHFLVTMDLRKRATMLLQRRIRGTLCRMQLKKMIKMAIKLQALYRGGQGREKHTDMLLNRAAGRFSSQFRAAERVKNTLRRFIKRLKSRRNEAATKIQSACRCRSAKKVSTQMIFLTEKQKLLEEKEREKARAATLIGKMARDRHSIKVAKKERTFLLLEREKRERRVREENAAISIQDAVRKRLGAKKVGELKESRMTAQLLLEKYQSVSKGIRAVRPKPSLKNSVGHWVRFQNKNERTVSTEEESPLPTYRSENPEDKVNSLVLYPLREKGLGSRSGLRLSETPLNATSITARKQSGQAVSLKEESSDDHAVPQLTGQDRAVSNLNLSVFSPLAPVSPTPLLDLPNEATNISRIDIDKTIDKAINISPLEASMEPEPVSGSVPVPISEPALNPSKLLLEPASGSAFEPISGPGPGQRPRPLLINLNDLSKIPAGTKVEAMYGSEFEWFAGTVTEIITVTEMGKNQG